MVEQKMYSIPRKKVRKGKGYKLIASIGLVKEAIE